MRKMLVGGTFDNDSGKSSYIVSQLKLGLGEDWECVNGGNLEFIKSFNPIGLNALIWMPNISNDEDKTLDRLKPQNPEMILVQSKRVIEKEYKPSDVIGRMLKSHSGMGFMISKPDGKYNYKLLDPLGNIWSDTYDIIAMATTLSARLNHLLELTRIRSVSVPKVSEIQIEDQFIDIIKQYGDRFATFISAVNPNRLLGNASTRCTKGFPAVRDDMSNNIFVTRRNVDKQTLTSNDFVAAKYGLDGRVEYQGLNKPSVDTPIQLKLFDYYTNVKYMIHGHAYVQDGLFTEDKIPCGYVEEFDEIHERMPDASASNFVINLLGHGCLIMASDLEYLSSHLDKLYARPVPEK